MTWVVGKEVGGGRSKTQTKHDEKGDVETGTPRRKVFRGRTSRYLYVGRNFFFWTVECGVTVV